ncbi:MAG: putative LPS assembly protein LptD, partial [Methanomicrobium sp.]|nr:putative LPS assembly protein LptD [Methanomicrobium sp.]
FKDGKSIIYYYGEVSVTYGDIALKADYMRYDLDNNTVFARGTKDSTGTVTGMPEMSDRGTTYTMEELTYNFTTRKAKIKHMVTQQSEGILRGENLKMMPDQSINIAGGQYTVCDAEHPHYFLKMTAAKVMTKPNQKTVFGPAYVVVEDVPLPIVLPFGFVPEMPDRSSGVLIPTYGEETARGLYLRDLGYSFVFGNYLDLAITGDIYSYGSWSTEITSRYKKRYAFDGNLSLTYSNDVTGEKGSEDFFQSKNFGVSWSHSQDSKARPGTSFKASVNFSSPSNSRYNSANISESLQNQVSSSISYSKTWSGMSLSVNALHSQNSRDSSYSITLPNVTFSVNRFYPFKQKNRVGKEKIYEKISLSYNTTLQNKINFKVSELDEENFWNKLQNGMTHNFSIGLPSFNLFKYFQFSPSVSYGMNWYFREKQLKYNEETQKVESFFTDQFSTFGISQNFSSGISMGTRLYGIFNFGKRSNLQAIRHMITPSISFSYKPEMGTSANGYTSLTYIDSDGKEVIKEYNKYSDMIYSPVSKGKTAALSFAIGNNLEAKIKNPQDTTGKGNEKVKLLDQLNLSGSYNFLADSMRLSNISVTASTTIFGKLGINGNATFDPYAINERGIRYNELNIIKEGGFNIARLTNASASLSYSLSADGKYEGNDGTKDKKDTNSDYARVYYNPVTGEYIPGGWVYYLNPSIPWSLSFNLNYSFSRTYQYLNEQLLIKNNHIQTVSISGQIHLTKALNMNFNTGFDLTKLKMTTSQLSATYDLHCFAISVSWVPNGKWESWSFRIAAKASALSDLLQFKKASSYWDK